MTERIKDFNDLPAVISVWPGLGQTLGVSRQTAYNLIKEDGFPALRISSRKIIIPKDKLLQYLEQKAEAGLK